MDWLGDFFKWWFSSDADAWLYILIPLGLGLVASVIAGLVWLGGKIFSR